MALIYWYKDNKTHEAYYYDTDDLNDEQYKRVSEIDKLLNEDPMRKDSNMLKQEKNNIIKQALDTY